MDNFVPSVALDSPVLPGVRDGRLNANGVDLNRNWDCAWRPDAEVLGEIVPESGGTAPFSEPETKALRDFLLDLQPRAVVFWEARATSGLVSPGLCGEDSNVSQTLADVYGFAAGFHVADFEVYSNVDLTGDSSNWLDENGIPAIAVLLKDYSVVDWERNWEGIQAVLTMEP